jgi:hypothetical protein
MDSTIGTQKLSHSDVIRVKRACRYRLVSIAGEASMPVQTRQHRLAVHLICHQDTMLEMIAPDIALDLFLVAWS